MTTEYHNTRGNKPPNRSQQMGDALRAAASGRAVFPLKGKEPTTGATPNGYKDASRLPQKITMMFNAAKDRATGYGIATGQASGVVVVDVDGPEARVEAERLGITSDYVVKTCRPGGDGWHVYFSIPKGLEVRSRTLARGVELIAEGRYVVGPGSRHPSGGVYKVAKAGAPAHAPEWITEPPVDVVGAHAAGGARPGARPTDDGGPIFEGSRNRSLFFIALDLKDRGRSREEALTEVMAVNDARCAPPLPDDEVVRVVTSAYRYPVRGGRTPPEVDEALAGVKARWWRAPWRGVGGKTERDIVRTMIEFAERYGIMIPPGVRFSISYRDLALAAGVSLKTVQRVVKRLRLHGWIRGDNANRSGTDSGAFVLLARVSDHTQGTGGSGEEPNAESVATLSRLPEITPCFRWRGFVGKGKAGVLYALEVFGEQSVEELSERLGFKRPRDLRRLYLEPLAELGLVEDRGGVYALPREDRYAERVEEIREAPYGGGERKVRHKEGERWVISVRDYPAKSEVERTEDDALAYDGARDRYRKKVMGVPDDVDAAPAPGDTRRRREGRPARRAGQIQRAIAALFADKPEYRARRVGQITCALVKYLPDDFAPGAIGYPKDAEVEQILEGVAA